jgi:NAD(P)H-dependent flavin oxidoreductase YrpB (nitropropane dioxygenase family)
VKFEHGAQAGEGFQAQVAVAFMPGASAVQMGTAFLRCEGTNVRDAHRAALREANDACTIVTDMLTGRPARYIRMGPQTISSPRRSRRYHFPRS